MYPKKFSTCCRSPSTEALQIMESGGGPHDFLNFFIFYDHEGNNKNVMKILEPLNYLNLLPSVPLALSKLLPSEVWNAIGIAVFGN